MYIDNIGKEQVIGAYPCNIGMTGPTGPIGTKIMAKYYEIESVDTPLKGPGGLEEFIVDEYTDGIVISLPPFLFDGKEYTSLYIIKTGLVYFQEWDIILNNYNAGNPPIPCLLINASENSLQRVYFGLEEGDTQFRIRYEGTNEPTGIVGQPNVVWELTYYYNNPGRFDIVFGEITPVVDIESVNAISSGQGYLGQFDITSNTAYRIYPNEKLVNTINIKGDGFRTGIHNDVLYIDIEPFYPLVIEHEQLSNITSIRSPNILNIDSTSILRFSNTDGKCDIKTKEYDSELDPNYYGNIYINPGYFSTDIQRTTNLNNVQLLNIPQYNSNSIPTGPENLVWVDENNFLRVL